MVLVFLMQKAFDTFKRVFIFAFIFVYFDFNKKFKIKVNILNFIIKAMLL